MKSNPGTFGITVKRVPPVPVEDTIVITLTIGDARRLHSMMVKGLPDSSFDTISGLRDRLIGCLEDVGINYADLG